jgi:tetraacyldisaccharide 4'-kinase
MVSSALLKFLNRSVLTTISDDALHDINSLRRKIESVMGSDASFSRLSPVSVLTIVSLMYGAAVKLRAAAYRSGRLRSRKLPCKVISIGNITTGGTGKTPMTLYLAEWLHRSGWHTAVVSRGYKGGAEEKGGVVSDGKKILLPSAAAGDEPYLLAAQLLSVAVPVVVGRNRYEAGMLAVRHFKPDVILLDDAFQHLQLSRDIDLVLLDGRRPFGNGYLVPRGTLREPVSALSRGDIFILTRAAEKDEKAFVDRLHYIVGLRPVYTAAHKPVLSQWVPAAAHLRQKPTGARAAPGLRSLRGRSVFGFAGIAGNDGFKETLTSLGCELAGFAGFADHHRYSTADVAALLQAAGRSGADLVCTTEKDYSRLAEHLPWSVDVAVIGIEMSLGSRQAAFEKAVISRLGPGAGA